MTEVGLAKKEATAGLPCVASDFAQRCRANSVKVIGGQPINEKCPMETQDDIGEEREI